MPTYFCFIERDIIGTTHMEALDADSEDEARAEAEALLQTHASGIAAHILLDDVRIATLRRLAPDRG
ncbi:hypothetical protein [Brevundimonas subvibrioides]|uniref:hypothetical protein n=1 Tax=Brevundimonas subvibrioides TaxID=74313 RepID=UPI0022B38928|nr:hypothetical protein [Brevundimonas subvibrioides]